MATVWSHTHAHQRHTRTVPFLLFVVQCSVCRLARGFVSCAFENSLLSIAVSSFRLRVRALALCVMLYFCVYVAFMRMRCLSAHAMPSYRM